MEIFTVTTLKNIETVILAVSRHAELHPYSHYTIICPANELEQFRTHLTGVSRVRLISEDDVLDFGSFARLCSAASRAHERSDFNPKRLKWYYQQALKLAYALESCESRLIMWDADTVPLVRINFFDHESSVSYGSLIEYNHDYFRSIKKIFEFDAPKLAFTIQFFTLTAGERSNLIALLRRFREREACESFSQWVAAVIMSAVASAHSRLELQYQSYFSEQELVGLANSVVNQSSQKGIRHFRPGRFWRSSPGRIRIIKALGYEYFTIERNIIPAHSIVEALFFWGFCLFDIFRHFHKYVEVRRRKRPYSDSNSS
jgi:hypothetical protein